MKPNHTFLQLILTFTSIGYISTASAHHGWSGYDASTIQKLQGTIEKSTYSNPHGTLQLMTAEKTSLNIILAPTGRMQDRGLTKEMLKPGTKVSIEGYFKKEDPKEVRAERITVDSKTVELR